MSWVQQMYYFPHSKSLLPANLRCLEFGWSTYLSQRGKREKWRSSGSKSKLTIFSSVTVKKKGKREFPPLRRNRRRGKREERERESEKDGEREREERGERKVSTFNAQGERGSERDEWGHQNHERSHYLHLHHHHWSGSTLSFSTFPVLFVNSGFSL